MKCHTWGSTPSQMIFPVRLYLAFHTNLSAYRCPLSSGERGPAYPSGWVGQLRTCMALAGKMFYEEAFCQQLLSVVSRWKEHFSFHLTCRGVRAPHGEVNERV